MAIKNNWKHFFRNANTKPKKDVIDDLEKALGTKIRWDKYLNEFIFRRSFKVGSILNRKKVEEIVVKHKESIVGFEINVEYIGTFVGDFSGKKEKNE